MISVFYPTDHLSLDESRAILLLAKEKCRRWWVDKLDCSESLCRQKVEVSFDEIMQKFDSTCLFNVIHRNNIEDYLEVGFCTVGSVVDHFLWIIIDPIHIPEFKILCRK